MAELGIVDEREIAMWKVGVRQTAGTGSKWVSAVANETSETSRWLAIVEDWGRCPQEREYTPEAQRLG